MEEYLEEKCFFHEGKAAFQVTLKDGSHGFLCKSDGEEIERKPPATAEALIRVESREQNRMALSAMLKNLLEKELFCPECGHTMLECSKCHKTLQESLKPYYKEAILAKLSLLKKVAKDF